MANEVKNNANEVANEKVTKVTITNATVTKVMIPKGDTSRITFVTDKTFETIDMKTKETKETQNFSLNIYEVVNQIGTSVPEIQLADTLAMGKQVNPEIIALAMTNATIDFVRDFKAEGEQRRATDDVYKNDCWTTTIVKVTTHIAPIFAQMLTNKVMTQPAVVTMAGTPNPFNV